jgi:AraC-like DNA-binding protein
MKVLPFTMLVPDDKSVIAEHVTLPYFYQYLHRHDEWQITFIERGEGTLIAGSDMHAFRTGDIFVIGAKLPHLFKSNPEYFQKNEENAVSAYSIYFNSSGALGPLFSLPEMKLANAFLTKNRNGFKVPFKFSIGIIDSMINVYQSSGTELLFAFIRLITTLQQIGEEVIPICSDLYSSNVSENEGMRLSKIISFITENYNKQITLEDVANVAFMTPQAFCRYFKKHTGHTFVSFLNEVRINDACKKLISGQKNDCISGVAYNAGFNSITNFNRVFKSIIGQSPRTYLETFNNVSRVSQIRA